MAADPQSFTPMTPPPLAVQQQQMGPQERPIGVTIIAILYIIGGAGLLLVGIMVLALGAVGRSLAKSFVPWSGAGTVVAALAIVIAIVLFALGALALAGGIGNLHGSGWARVLVIILAALGFLNDVSALFRGTGRGVGSAIVGMLIQGFILWYYFRPEVKRYFSAGHGMSQQQQVVIR